MRVELIERTGGPERLVCEAALIFDAPEDPQGLKLVGFCLWRGTSGELYATMPARAFGSDTQRRFFDLLCSIESGSAAAHDARVRVSRFLVSEYNRRFAASDRASASGPVDAAGRVESVDGCEAQQGRVRPPLPTALGKPAERTPVSHKRPRGRASRGKKTGSKSNA